ncbi:MAG: DUF4126 domain-containing protein [Geobacteraceae bacterium]
METVIGLAIGSGLSAAAGFRVFVPLLGLSIATMSGYLTLSQCFQWLGTWPALIAFATASVLEICAYYIPWVDNMLDALMTPAAVVAGTISTASLMGDVSPFLKWSAAIIAGGGISAIVQGGTVALRATSSTATGGVTNSMVSSVELAGSTLLTVCAIVIPVICLVIVVWICVFMARKIMNSHFIKSLFPRKNE